MILIFEGHRLPRSMTREQWRKVDRWRRLTNQQLRAQVERRTNFLRDLGAYGSAELQMKIANEICNPPIMVFPDLNTRELKL